MKAPNRRAFIRTASLSAVMATAALGAAAAAPDADAELIGLCARFDELGRLCAEVFAWQDRSYGPDPEPERIGPDGWPLPRQDRTYVNHCRAIEEEGQRRRAPFEEERDALFERMMEIPPTTLAGAKALAVSWRAWDEGEMEKAADEDGYVPDRFAWALVQGLSGVGA